MIDAFLIKVRVFFRSADGYVEVHSFYIETLNRDSDGLTESRAEEAFTTLNSDHPLDWVHRSLSFGDVAVVAETALLCTNTGWEQLDSDELLAAKPADLAAADHLTSAGNVPQEILDDLDAA